MTDEKNDLAEVSSVEGFLPKFARAFTDAHGGRDSLFVRATSDYFTIALVGLQDDHGLRGLTDPVGLFAPPAAFGSLRKLLHRLYTDQGHREVALTLLNEAFGARPAGTFAGVVDDTLGQGFFTEWIVEIESGSYENADRIVDRKKMAPS